MQCFADISNAHFFVKNKTGFTSLAIDKFMFMINGHQVNLIVSIYVCDIHQHLDDMVYTLHIYRKL